MVPMNPEGGAWTAPRAPQLILHGTLAAGVSQTFYGVVQGMELQNFRTGRQLYSDGQTSVHILVFVWFRAADGYSAAVGRT